jgi:hypothetical protein
MPKVSGRTNAESKRRAWTLLGVLGTALLVAMATAIGTGSGQRIDAKRETAGSHEDLVAVGLSHDVAGSSSAS